MAEVADVHYAPALETQGFDSLPTLRPYRTKATNTLWTLMDHLWYRDIDGNLWWAPKGMLTDLASIPHVVDGAFINIEHRIPGVIHDAGYLLSLVTGEKRATLDALFGEMCAFMGGTTMQAAMLRAGLDLGGWHSWNECQHDGVTWADFDITVLNDAEIADYRERFKIPDPLAHG